jgi:hypothetical protein
LSFRSGTKRRGHYSAFPVEAYAAGNKETRSP